MKTYLTKYQYKNRKNNLKKKIKKKNKIEFDEMTSKIYNNLIENIFDIELFKYKININIK